MSIIENIIGVRQSMIMSIIEYCNEYYRVDKEFEKESSIAYCNEYYGLI